MDAKITKQRLSRLLSYDWIKIVALCVAAILVWSLVFTMTATKITASQQFTVFNYTYNGVFKDSFYSHYSKTFRDKTFSYEVLEINQQDLAASGAENAYTLLEGRLGTSEGDVMFIPHIDDPATKIEPTEEGGEVTYQYKHTEVFFNNWYYYVADVDEYLDSLRQYLSGYYENGDYANGVLNEQKVIQDFDARAKRNEDKRFRKAKDIESGRGAELDRIQKYADALETFENYLADGLIQFVPLEVKTKEGKILRSGNFAVNLCPDKEKTGNLKNLAYYNVDGDGVKESAENMCVMFFDLEDVENTFEYESLLYVNAVIESSRTDK